MAAIAKLLLIIINSIFMLISFVVAAVGAILAFIPGKFLGEIYDSVKSAVPSDAAYTIPDDADSLSDVPFFNTIGLALFALGVTLLIISFMAYVGACCPSCCRCLLVLYAILLVIFIIVEVSLGSLFFISDSPLHDRTKETLQDLIEDEYHDNGTDAFSQAMNIFHIHFDCCGIEGSKDFGVKLHRSCDPANLNVGCYSKIQDEVEDNIVWCIVGLACLVVLQLIELYCAITVYKDNSIKIGPI